MIITKKYSHYDYPPKNILIMIIPKKYPHYDYPQKYPHYDYPQKYLHYTSIYPWDNHGSKHPIFRQVLAVSGSSVDPKIAPKPRWTVGCPIGGTDSIYKAYFLGLCKGISPQNMALYGTVPILGSWNSHWSFDQNSMFPSKANRNVFASEICSFEDLWKLALGSQDRT